MTEEELAHLVAEGEGPYLKFKVAISVYIVADNRMIMARKTPDSCRISG